MKQLLKISALSLSVIFLFALHDAVNAGEHKEKAVMQMPEELDMRVLEIDGYKVTFHVMDMPVYHKLMKSMGVKHSEMEGGTSHHVMVEILDNKGEKVGGAAVKIKVVDPRDSSEEKALKPMEGQLGQYGADFRIIHKGKHQIMVLFNVDGNKHKGGYWYEMK